jgi:hypothetical protein
MKYLLNSEKLVFKFEHYSVSYYNYGYSNYQANRVLSFAIMDLFSKIIKQQKRRSIILKKRKSIIHLLNYVDVLNFNHNDSKFDITFLSKNRYKTSLVHNLYLYRIKPFKDFDYKNSLEVIERKDLCIIRFDADYASEVQPKNSNLTAMLMHILEKKEIDIMDADSVILYCVLLM